MSRPFDNMLNDARTLETGARLDADVCIVGSGAAGLTVAHELATTGASVVVLESGGQEPDAGIDGLSMGRARGRLFGRSNRYLTASRTRRFGGLTHSWHRTCRPLDREDLIQRDWVPDSGWPLNEQELTPYYQRAATLLGLPPPSPTGDLLADDGRFDGSWLAYATPTALGADWRRGPTAAPNIEIFTHATVTMLELEAGGARVETAMVRCLDGPRFKVRASRFVLAAGALENARLLLASNSRRSKGLGNEHDLVGRFFMDQVVMRAGFVTLPGSAGVMASYREPDGESSRRAIMRPQAAFQARHELLNSLALFEPAEIERGGSLAAAVGRSVSGLHRLAGQSGGSGDFFGRVTLRGEQRPHRDSRLLLAAERDALGVPRIDLSWRLSDHDSWSLRTTARLLGESLGRRGLGRLQLRVRQQLRRRDFGWSGHHSGTTRMSRQPSTGVVDPDCRVHDLPNLFVAGSSVFPTSGCSGPMLTTLALSLRLGGHLRQDLDA